MLSGRGDLCSPGIFFRSLLGLYLSYSLLDSARAGLLVSFPEGMVSCRPGQVLVLEFRVFCRVMCLL